MAKERNGGEEPEAAGIGNFEKEFYCSGKRGKGVIAEGENGVNKRVFLCFSFSGKNASMFVS